MNQSALTRLTERFGGWILIIIIIAIPVAVWYTMNPISEMLASPQSAFYYFGKLFSIIGFVLFALNFVLSTRAKWLEYFFGGLNRVYTTHHIIGGLALCFIAFHPMLLALNYIELSNFTSIRDVATFLLPKSMDLSLPFATLVQNAASNAGSIAYVGMVVLLVITFFVKLPYQIWLFTHKFLGVAFLLACLHTLLISSDVSRNNFLFYYMLAISVIGLLSYTYRTILGNIIIRRAKYKIVSTEIVSGNTLVTELEAIGKTIDFKPGQFVFVRFKSDDNIMISGESHPFSIASSPKEKNLRFYIKALGDYTKTLDKLQSGQIAELEGAFGKFSYSNYPDKSQIWIAGGIGVTPFLGMARNISDSSPQIDMYYCVNKSSELVEQDYLKDELPVSNTSFKYHSYIYEEKQSFLTAEQVKNDVGDLRGKEIFICGPDKMMKSLRMQFRKLGVPNSKIHSEEFSL